jgi:EAL domain-containing protein (putative c-di-GMP-specific phosphodiesterase class I)
MNSHKLTHLYQPIVDMLDLRLARYEALLRVEGVSNIEVMIKELERSGEIIDLDLHMLKAVISDMKTSHALSMTPVAINLSGVSLSDPSFQDRACDILGERPARIAISLEITESAPITDINAAARFIKRMQRAGCTFGMDDFGDGHARLELIDELHLDYLKLSSCLTRNLFTSPEAANLVGLAVAMAESRGVDIVAEHVEDVQQYQYLRNLGIRYGQGWLFAKAGHPIIDIEAFERELSCRL